MPCHTRYTGLPHGPLGSFTAIDALDMDDFDGFPFMIVHVLVQFNIIHASLSIVGNEYVKGELVGLVAFFYQPPSTSTPITTITTTT
jgi:hypothetical protein